MSPVILTCVGALAAGTATGVLADKTTSAGTYFSILAALTIIVTGIGFPAWRGYRAAKKERAEQRALLVAVHDAIYGRDENRAQGVEKIVAIRDRLETVERILAEGSEPMRHLSGQVSDLQRTTDERLDLHQQQIAEARRVAGTAATAAAAAADRIEFLSGRMWESHEALLQREAVLTAVLTEAGFEVGSRPDETAVGDDGPVR